MLLFRPTLVLFLCLLSIRAGVLAEEIQGSLFPDTTVPSAPPAEAQCIPGLVKRPGPDPNGTCLEHLPWEVYGRHP